jgi:hypothetical protein
MVLSRRGRRRDDVGAVDGLANGPDDADVEMQPPFLRSRERIRA